MTEAWPTDADLAQARERFAATIPGWRWPAAHGIALVTFDGTASLLTANTDQGRLAAVVLAGVLGHAGGSATYEVSAAQLEAAIRAIAPAEAATHLEHPNLAAWRTLREAFAYDTRAQAHAVFVADLSDPLTSRYDEMLRWAVSDG